MPTVYYLKLDQFFDDYFPELAESTPPDLKRKLEKDGGVWYTEDGNILTVYNDVSDAIPISPETTFDFFNFGPVNNKKMVFGIDGISHSTNKNFTHFILNIIQNKGA